MIRAVEARLARVRREIAAAILAELPDAVIAEEAGSVTVSAPRLGRRWVRSDRLRQLRWWRT